MTTATETPTRRVRIVPDTDPESPREWDNVGRMVTWHDRYNLGDDQPKESPDEWMRDYAGELVGADLPDDIAPSHVHAIINKHAVILPLYLYDHSGLSMSCASFSDPWDSGQVGWIVVSVKRARDEWGDDWKDKADRCLRAEVASYDQFLRGDVYGFVIEEREVCETCGAGEWDTVDSCWGFYGHDVDANGMTDHMEDEDAELARAAEVDYS